MTAARLSPQPFKARAGNRLGFCCLSGGGLQPAARQSRKMATCQNGRRHLGFARQRMIPKSGNRFSDKIMRKQNKGLATRMQA
jgi:hypothetical protein